VQANIYADRIDMKVPLSILIPTKNEEKNILKCMQAVSWADQVIVVDSLSTDRTVELATGMGAEVVQFLWDRKGPRKKNWALDNLLWKHEWILVVDADEEVTSELRDEIIEVLASGTRCEGFLVRYKFYFLDRLLKHGAPLWKLILFRRHVRFELLDMPEFTGYDVEVHEHPIVHGKIGRLRSRMIHHDFDDLHHHFARHNIYSDWEALRRTRYKERDLTNEIRPRLFGSNVERRRFLKNIFLDVLPGKPWIHFFHSYLLRCGFLDGRPGFVYSVLKAFYWYEVSAKVYELRLHRLVNERPGNEAITVNPKHSNGI
jgi:glycosyltransferase involved in cell wall biosynthesis